MRLGVGIATTPARRGISWNGIVTPDVVQHICCDEKYEGVAYTRNTLIETLMAHDCDYIAICDDDLMYHTPEWLTLTTMAMSGFDLPFVCLPEIMKGKRTDIEPGLEKWDGYIGAFYILSRRAINEVGYFSTKFKGYGFEDAHYKHRLHKQYGEVGIPSILPYLVSSMDVLGLNPTPSRTDKEEQIKKNHPIYLSEIENGIIYYPNTLSQLDAI